MYTFIVEIMKYHLYFNRGLARVYWQDSGLWFRYFVSFQTCLGWSHLSFRFLKRGSQWFLWRCLLMLVLSPLCWIMVDLLTCQVRVSRFSVISVFPEVPPAKNLVVHSSSFPQIFPSFCSDTTGIYRIWLCLLQFAMENQHHAILSSVFTIYFYIWAINKPWRTVSHNQVG